MHGTKAILTIGLTLAITTPASAFYVESRATDDTGARVPAKYALDGPLEFRLASNLDSVPGAVDAVRAAFQSWGGIECSTLGFAEGERVDEPTWTHYMYDEGEVYILVFFEDDPSIWATPQVGQFVFAHDPTGTMIGGSVMLNSKDHRWSVDGEANALDVQSVATALIGRSLGITSAMEGNATYPRYLPGNTDKRTLGDDDVAAIQYLYGDLDHRFPALVEIADVAERIEAATVEWAYAG